MVIDSKSKTYIYTLADPITDEVRYIGKSNNPKLRFKNHLNKCRDTNTHKRNWINKLKTQGLKPILNIIDEVDIENWIFWENYWISQFRTWGFNLLNYTSGGEGTTFGNQTSFKKGHRTWNTGTANTKTCEVCGSLFKVFPASASKRRTCSHKCGSIIKKNILSNTQFKKECIPWNKGLTYKTKKQ